MIVPWLSSHNTYVYVTVDQDAYMIKYLPQFCRFMDFFPFTPYEKPTSSIQVTEILKSGFQLDSRLWLNLSVSLDYNLIPTCWTSSKKVAYDWLGTGKYRNLQKMFFPIVVWFNFFDCLGLFHKSNLRYITMSIILYSLFVLSILFAYALICRVVLFPLAVCAFLVHDYWKNTRPIDNVEKFLRNQQNLSPIRYSFANITAMTRNFKEKLGKGGFGSVFKGELLGGRLVAVKVLGSLKFSGEDFINEVSTIGRIHHVNIVQLLGFCSEGANRALIYEYMPNGSLDKYIFSSNDSITLDQLNKIALGIARGIDYLHCGCDMQILHFDIKPHNILLDHNFTPKISDFGLAKMYPRDHSLVCVSAARGTIGYIAPELISRNFGVISYKSDVYSFGMLLLDIAGRRRKFNTVADSSNQIYYPSWIYGQLNQQAVSNFEGNIEIEGLERKLCKVGLWCIQMDSSKRPSMDEVIVMLEADEDHIEMPPKPFFSTLDARNKLSCTLSSSAEFSEIIEHDQQFHTTNSSAD